MIIFPPNNKAAVCSAPAILAALLLSGCTLPGGSVDDFLDNPGPAHGPNASAATVDAARIYRNTAHSVVTVIVDYDGDGSADGLGSGFAVDPTTIITNVHVIGDLMQHKRADDVFVQLRDGNRYPAAIVGTDSHADVAVLSVDYADRAVADEAADALADHSPPKDRKQGLEPPRLRPLAFGSTSDLAVGDQVAAVGAPLGEPDSLAIGYITGLGRTIPGLAGFNIVGAIQTDAAITLGNSGGPMLSAAGEVIGINNQIATVGGGGEGLAFAIPAEVVENSLREIKRSGHVKYAYLGARTRPVPATLRRGLGLPADAGVVVFSVRDNSPAARAGLRGSDKSMSLAGSEWPEEGDYIVAVDGRPLRQNEKLTSVLARYRPGDSVRLRVWREVHPGSGTAFTSINVTLGKRPLLWGE